MTTTSRYVSIPELQKGIREDAFKKCKIFYSPKICTTWETGDGWNKILYDFSIKCEELNLRFYKKYRIKVVATQIKQKFGDLRIYCSFVQDPPFILRFLRNILEKIINKFTKVDFNYKTVDSTPWHQRHVIKIFKSESDRKKEYFGSTNEHLYDWDNRFILVTHFGIPGTTKMKPTKNKFKHFILYFFLNISKRIEKYHKNPPEINSLVLEYIEVTTNQYIREAEKQAARTCEKCGCEYNSPNELCRTIGWVSFICEKCACENDRKYVKDGKIYEYGKYIKDLKQMTDDDEEPRCGG